MPPVRRKTTFFVLCGSLCAVVAAMCIATVALTHGTLTYIIDDVYIHLTMARNFVDHGTWGMVPGEFESSSSSPGWVAFLGLWVKLLPGIMEWLPMLINLACCFGILSLFAYQQDVVAIRGRSIWRMLGVLLLPSMLFLPGLVMLGMEHSLHTLLVLLMLLQFERMTQGDITPRRALAYGGLLLATTAIRMETAFLALSMGIVLIWPVLRRLRHHEWRAIWCARAGVFVVSGLVPAAVILAIGLIDVSHGQYFMPNSIVEKTQLLGSGIADSLVPHLSTTWDNLSTDPFLICVLGLGVIAIAQKVRLRAVWIAWLAATLLHATYAQFGWYERYQAYLLISGVFLALRTLPEMHWASVPRRRVVIMGLLFALLPAIKYNAIIGGPASAMDQYVHQEQTARFLAMYYDGQTVMVNDIGHVTYRHTGGLVDMWALGSFEVLKAQHDGYYNATYAEQLAREHHAVIVVNADFEFNPYVPKGWVKVAHWEVNHMVDKREAYLDFWAPNPVAAGQMRANMRAFMTTMLNNSDSIPSIVG